MKLIRMSEQESVPKTWGRYQTIKVKVIYQEETGEVYRRTTDLSEEDYKRAVIQLKLGDLLKEKELKEMLKMVDDLRHLAYLDGQSR